MGFISVTPLRVRSFVYLPRFFWYTIWSIRQAEWSSGFVGGGLLRNAKNVLWTVTAWKDEVSLQNENVLFEQSRNVRFHRWPRAAWRRSELH
jgi:hypothetical protein